MDKFISKRVKNLPTGGGLYEIFQKALDVEASGRRVIHMEIGRPDFDSPIEAKEATIKALNDGFVHYTPMSGIEELKLAIRDKYKRERDIDINIENEIMVTAGACEALFSIAMSILDEDDEIIIPSPYFSAYRDETILSGGKVVEVPLRVENDFMIDVKDIENAITDKTKAIVINSPHNPTGTILGMDILKEVAALAIKHDLLVISDECYDAFIFEGEHTSIINIENMRERTIIINSASKTFSMTGWRVGFAIAPKEIIKYANDVHKNMSTCATSFAQVGVAEAYNNSSDFTVEMVKEFKRRRDLVIEHLDNIDQLEYVKPEGAFYVFVSIEKLNMTGKAFCEYLLEETGVALTPGDAFGRHWGNFVRIAFSSSYEQVEEAMVMIKDAVDKLDK